MSITKERFLDLVQAQKELFEAADALFKEYRDLWVSILGEKLDGSVFDGVGIVAPYRWLYPKDIDSDTIGYGADEYWSYGGHEYHCFSLPSRYLYENWRIEATTEFENRLAQYKARIKAQAEEQKNKEIAQLKALRDRYPEAT